MGAASPTASGLNDDSNVAQDLSKLDDRCTSSPDKIKFID